VATASGVTRCRSAASRALERGTRFLLTRQHSDGLWRDFRTPAGEASEWPTGFVGTALHVAGAEASALELAADRLVASQNDDGGWGYNEDVPTDADSTAWVLLFLCLRGRRETTSRRAARRLVGHQGRDGGIATYSDAGPIRRYMGVGRWVRFDGWCSAHAEVTSTAGRALAALAPDDPGAEADAAWRYVRSRQRGDGSWSSYWWTSPHYATQQAVELALSVGDRSAADRAVEWALRSQADDGGWSAPGDPTSVFATALSLALLLRAGAGGQATDHAVQRLVSLQDDDGGWPSQSIMRVPLPSVVDPDKRRRWRVGGRGFVVRDQHRTFTSATCVAALAQAREATA
jgi:squalene cyclase